MKKLALVLAVGLALGAASAALGEGLFTWKVRRGPVEIWQNSGAPYWWSFYNAAAEDTNGLGVLLQCPVVAESTLVIGVSPIHVRNIQVTICDDSGANNNGISAADVTVTGTNSLGATITEVFDVTANTAATIVGNKAFASIASITIGQQDDTGAKVSLGVGNKIGAPFTFTARTSIFELVDSTPESTRPTYAGSATDIESCTYDFNTDPNGSRDYNVLMWIPPVSVVTARTPAWH